MLCLTSTEKTFLEGGETSCLFSVVGGFFDFKRGGKGVGVGELVNWWIWKLVGCDFGGGRYQQKASNTIKRDGTYSLRLSNVCFGARLA